MSHIPRKFRVGIAALISIICASFPLYANAAAAPVIDLSVKPDVIITEFQTNGGKAAQEFIELYNQTDQPIDFGPANTTALTASWKLQFFGSAIAKTDKPDWNVAPSVSNTIPLSGIIPPHEYYLITSTDYKPNDVTADLSYSSSSSHLMADTGGGLQLLHGEGQPVFLKAEDRVRWLSQSSGGGLQADVLATPATGQSLQRLPNDDTEYIEVDGGLTSFGETADISPLDAWQEPVVVVEPVPPAPEPLPDTPTSTTTGSATDSPDTTPDTGSTTTDGSVTPSGTIGQNIGLSTPLITELLPNPASPLTDAHDEFIELYNPNSVSFSLDGYILEVGTTTLHSYTFTSSDVMAPASYQAYYSVNTKLSMTNSGGQVRLRAPDKSVVSETTAYGTAADGQSWILSDGVWQWTTSPTPALVNVLAVPAGAAKSTSTIKTTAKPKTSTTAQKTTTKKATTTSKTATKKTATKKTTVKKAKTKKLKTTSTAALSAATAVKPKPPIHMAILVVVAVAAVLYGLYEYRHDISNKFRQLVDYRKARRAPRPATSWR